ncbi:MAG: HAD-IA family hydrolase [Betaproteobacteria bacterium]|nr:HAD-IA family hydrolase [Betaproteobacteria bacterium]
MSIKALIFDVDGTIADTEETHRQSFNAAFLEHGLSWDWSRREYAELLRISGGKERIAVYIESLRLQQQEKARLKGLVQLIHATKTRIYGELIADGRAPLRPGVARLIGEARAAGVRLAIASTTTSANVSALIGAQFGAEAWNWFEALACGDVVPRKKPAPDIYVRALGMLRLPAHACVAFEDSVNGLQSAKAAGLYTVVTPTQWSEGQEFGGADLLLRGLGDADAPLAAGDASLAGGPYLTLEGLQQLHAAALRQAAA